MSILIAIAYISYFILTNYIVLGLRKYKPKKQSEDYNDAYLNRFSILIPCRNEAKRIHLLLQSIESLKYDTHSYELIFIDDYSTDETYELIKVFQEKNDRLDIKLLKNNLSAGKKSALTNGVKEAKYDYIITTDADCFLPDEWLRGFHQHLQIKTSSMVIGPVVYRQPTNFLEQFQHDDFLSLQAVTISTAMHGKPILCNGANLCYKKKDFYSVKGFDQHKNMASGDDVLLMESFLQNKLEVDYLLVKSLPVITQPVSSWKSLIQQRKRWISKINKTQNFTNYLLLFSLGSYVLGFCSLLILGIFESFYYQVLFALIVFKWIMDYLIFNALAKKINMMLCYRKMMLSSCFYPLWIVFLGIISLNKSYIWKDKKFNL